MMVKVGDVVKKDDEVARLVPNIVLLSPLDKEVTVKTLLKKQGSSLLAGQGILVVDTGNGVVSYRVNVGSEMNH